MASNKKLNSQWLHEKTISYVFADVISRTPNQEFTEKFMGRLKEKGLISTKDLQRCLVETEESESEIDSDDSIDSESQEEEFQQKIGRLVYKTLTQKLFDIPYSHRHLAFRKVEVEGEQEVSAELSSQNSAKTTADKRVNKNLSEKDLKWVDYSTNEVHPFSNSELKATKMDSQVQLEGRLLDIVDDAWRKEKLPEEDIAVPLSELPDPESDNGNSGESVREQENKWTDLGLHQFSEANQLNSN